MALAPCGLGLAVAGFIGGPSKMGQSLAWGNGPAAGRGQVSSLTC